MGGRGLNTRRVLVCVSGSIRQKKRLKTLPTISLSDLCLYRRERVSESVVASLLPWLISLWWLWRNTPCTFFYFCLTLYIRIKQSSIPSPLFFCCFLNRKKKHINMAIIYSFCKKREEKKKEKFGWKRINIKRKMAASGKGTGDLNLKAISDLLSNVHIVDSVSRLFWIIQ